MKVEFSNEELLECLSEDIREYLHEAFSQWVDDAEQAIVDNLYKPISDKIIEKFNANQKFQEKIIDNLVAEIDTTGIYEEVKEKAINILSKKIVEKVKL